MKKLSDFKKRNEIKLAHSGKDTIAIMHPDPKGCLKDVELYNREYLYPFLTIDGNIINSKYKDLSFHFIAHPIDVLYIDYRLTKGGLYEVIGTDEYKVSDFKTYKEFLDSLYYDENEHFEPRNSYTLSLDINEDRGNYIFETVSPCWVQTKYDHSHYELDKLVIDSDTNYDIKEVEKIANVLNERSWEYDLTNYELEIFKDENGDTLEYIGSNFRGFEVYGIYYLFYSPKTKLIRSIFQCS